MRGNSRKHVNMSGINIVRKGFFLYLLTQYKSIYCLLKMRYKYALKFRDCWTMSVTMFDNLTIEPWITIPRYFIYRFTAHLWATLASLVVTAVADDECVCYSAILLRWQQLRCGLVFLTMSTLHEPSLLPCRLSPTATTPFIMTFFVNRDICRVTGIKTHYGHTVSH